MVSMRIQILLVVLALLAVVVLAFTRTREHFDGFEDFSPTEPIEEDDADKKRGNRLPSLPRSARPPGGAIVGTSLRRFRWIDPSVVPPGNAANIQNITQVSKGIFMHRLRMGNGWHDGDRNKTTGKYTEKGRAELCCLGGNTPYKLGETWLIGSTVMFDKNFVPSRGYCDIAQPVLHQSYFTWDLQGNTMVGSMMVFERGLGSRARLVRQVKVKRGEWFTWTLKVKFGKDGMYMLSINGDDFKGIRLDTRIGHMSGNQVGKVKNFGGTWGLYCMMNGKPRDLIVYHAYPFIKKL